MDLPKVDLYQMLNPPAIVRHESESAGHAPEQASSAQLMYYQGLLGDVMDRLAGSRDYFII